MPAIQSGNALHLEQLVSCRGGDPDMPHERQLLSRQLADAVGDSW